MDLPSPETIELPFLTGADRTGDHGRRGRRRLDPGASIRQL